MKFEVKAKLKYQINTDANIILNIHAMNNQSQKVLTENFNTYPEINFESLDSFPEKTRLISLNINNLIDFSIHYQAVVENAYQIKSYEQVDNLNISKLSSEVLSYLNPSRYCQSDKLYRLANNLFGYKKDDFEKVMSLTHWIHLNVEYLSGSTDSETSAYDTVTEQAGVCRDFAHLGIALCRALTIPARYFTGYAYQLNPQDFHACFEAYINGEWLLFDPTRLCPLNGMVKIAVGKDAADTAIASLFGEVTFVSSEVSCDLIDNHFVAFQPDYLSKQGISYL